MASFTPGTRGLAFVAASTCFLLACGGPTVAPSTPSAAGTARAARAAGAAPGNAGAPTAAAPSGPPAAPVAPPAPPAPAAPADDSRRAAAIEEAQKLVRATAEVAWLDRNLDGGFELDSEASCDDGGCDVRVNVDVDSETTFFSFVVARGGELRGIAPGGQETPYAAWSRAMQVELQDIDKAAGELSRKIAALPEIRAFFRGLKAAGHAPALWLEAPPRPDCHSDDLDCVFVFYVGGIGQGHASRYATVRATRLHRKLFIADLSMEAPVPYEAWRRRPRP